jgi:hypothetical protein
MKKLQLAKRESYSHTFKRCLWIHANLVAAEQDFRFDSESLAGLPGRIQKGALGKENSRL